MTSAAVTGCRNNRERIARPVPAILDRHRRELLAGRAIAPAMGVRDEREEARERQAGGAIGLLVGRLGETAGDRGDVHGGEVLGADAQDHVGGAGADGEDAVPERDAGRGARALDGRGRHEPEPESAGDERGQHALVLERLAEEVPEVERVDRAGGYARRLERVVPGRGGEVDQRAVGMPAERRGGGCRDVRVAHRGAAGDGHDVVKPHGGRPRTR
jgi:hypothetical protein